MICRDSDLPLIVAIDLQPMAPIEGVIQVQGDITNARTAEVVRILQSLHVELQFLWKNMYLKRHSPNLVLMFISETCLFLFLLTTGH